MRWAYIIFFLIQFNKVNGQVNKSVFYPLPFLNEGSLKEKVTTFEKSSNPSMQRIYPFKLNICPYIRLEPTPFFVDSTVEKIIISNNPPSFEGLKLKSKIVISGTIFIIFKDSTFATIQIGHN